MKCSYTLSSIVGINNWYLDDNEHAIFDCLFWPMATHFWLFARKLRDMTVGKILILKENIAPKIVRIIPNFRITLPSDSRENFIDYLHSFSCTFLKQSIHLIHPVVPIWTHEVEFATMKSAFSNFKGQARSCYDL